ncbi:MAG: hypothetical protein NTU47_02270 [Ignavibacteriales bacterium]|nr:hypothetical protein [Ignavibacteriales bacterium]
MDDNEKRHFDAVNALQERAWDQFNERRRYEIQVSMAFWTAIILAIAGSLTLVSFPDIPLGRISLAAIGVMIFSLHYYWCAGIMQSNRKDRLRAIEYQECLHQMLPFSYSPELKKDLEKSKDQGADLSNWSFIFQVGLTLVLVITLVVVNWNRFGVAALAERTEQKRIAVERSVLEKQVMESQIELNRSTSETQLKTGKAK